MRAMKITLDFWQLLAVCLVVASTVGWIAFKMIVTHYLPGYLAEKGKNLATKEDIGKITSKVEEVKTQYTLLVEQFKATQQLRFAALDKRLQIHQEAFTHWLELTASLSSRDPDRVKNAAEACDSWWKVNCLYLEPEVRVIFHHAVIRAQAHMAYAGRSQIFMNDQVSVANLQAIAEAGNAILHAVKLPALTQEEAQELGIRPGVAPAG
jgi:hypothetical protein